MNRYLSWSIAVWMVAGACYAAPELPSFMSNFADWHVRCFDIKTATPCDMITAVYRKATGIRVDSVSISYNPVRKIYMMQIAVPLGIAIQKGVVITVDDFKSAEMEVRRCDPLGCYVEGPADQALVDALVARDGRKASLDVIGDNGKSVSLPLSMKGIAAAKAALLLAALARSGAAASATQKAAPGATRR